MDRWFFVWELRPSDREKWLMVEVEGEGRLRAWYSKQNDLVFDRATTGRLLRWRLMNGWRRFNFEVFQMF